MTGFLDWPVVLSSDLLAAYLGDEAAAVIGVILGALVLGFLAV